MIKTNYIGKPANRVDGPLKVTGAAKYIAENNVPGMLYGYVLNSTIAKGRITSIDTASALAEKGVIEVFTHENTPGLAWLDMSYKDQDSVPGSPFRPLHSDKIMYSMQPIALVVAETFEQARYASRLIKVEYETEQPVTNLSENLASSYKAPIGKTGYQSPKDRGKAEKAFEEAPVKISATYIHGAEHNNPMEMHASIAIWEGDDKLTVYDKTQSVTNSKSYVTGVFSLSKKDVRVLSPFVGGAFGSGLRPQYQLFMAVLAALKLKRSVKVSLTRQQMFSFGHRPKCVQNVSLSALHDGTLQSIEHTAYGETSQFESYTEIIVNWSGLLYNCANVKLDYQLVKLDTYTPMDMRAPGAVTGVHAIESAMDELAYKLKMDPLELRLKNYAFEDQTVNKPFTSKELQAAYRQGAERFGWSKRSLEPRSMKEGRELIGWGMATASWDALHMPSGAKAVLSPDGKLTVTSGTSDIGTGTYTIMTQIAAETLGMYMEDVTFDLGDSLMPVAPLEGGSWTAVSVGSAVKKACEQVTEKLFKRAKKMDNSPFADADFSDVVFQNGQIIMVGENPVAVDIKNVMKGGEAIEETASSGPSAADKLKYSFHSHSATFVEVRIDEDLGITRVTRVVSAIAGGRILNAKTARSQVLGAVVWGISKALEEDSVMDHNYGRFMNHNFAEYHIPVNADIFDIDVIFVDEPDNIINPLGAKGLGEIGIVGVPAAVANAVFHATGNRVRVLPIHLNHLLGLEEPFV